MRLTLILAALCGCVTPSSSDVDSDGIRHDANDLIEARTSAGPAREGARHVARGMQAMVEFADDADQVSTAADELTQGLECMADAYDGDLAGLMRDLQLLHLLVLQIRSPSGVLMHWLDHPWELFDHKVDEGFEAVTVGCSVPAISTSGEFEEPQMHSVAA